MAVEWEIDGTTFRARYFGELVAADLRAVTAELGKRLRHSQNTNEKIENDYTGITGYTSGSEEFKSAGIRAGGTTRDIPLDILSVVDKHRFPTLYGDLRVWAGHASGDKIRVTIETK